jgi:hypothetical protein
MAIWYNTRYMAFLYILWSFGISFLFWYVLTKKNLATLHPAKQQESKRLSDIIWTGTVTLTVYRSPDVKTKLFSGNCKARLKLARLHKM